MTSKKGASWWLRFALDVEVGAAEVASNSGRE